MKHPRTSLALAHIESILQHEGSAFTLALLYVLANIIFFLFGAVPEWRHFEGKYVIMRLVIASARGGGALLNLNSPLILLVASRVFMTALRRTPLNMVVPFDKAMPSFHAIAGVTISIATLFHVVPHLVNYGVSDLARTGIHGHTSLAISGTALCIIVGIMRLTTTKTIRNVISYEAFYVIHLTGFVLYFGTVIIHGSNHGRFSTYKFVTGPLIVYAVDIILRRFRSRGKSLVTPGDSARTIGPRIVRLELPRPRTFWYLAGQYSYLNIPAISRYQWHPFSMASSPHEGTVVFYIKVAGDWTKDLYDLCSNASDPFIMNFDVYLRGPFGAPAQHVGQYEHVILISGGVGATPFTSITKFAHYWTMNYTDYGRDKTHSAYDAFKHYVTVHNHPAENEAQSRSRLPEHQIPGEVKHGLRGILNLATDSLRKTLQAKRQRTWARFSTVPKSLAKIFPPDYNPNLGDPNAPIPSRSEPVSETSKPPVPSRSTRSPFSANMRRISGECSRNRRSPQEAEIMFDNDEYAFVEAELLEEELIREGQMTASNRINIIGTNITPGEEPMFIPPYNETDKAIPNGMLESRTDAREMETEWKERFLIYLHSVTVNWVLLWIMMTRFAIVAIGRITHGFHLNQRGLSVYSNDILNIIDLVLSFVLFLPVLATVLTEILIYGSKTFFGVNVGNGFDLVIVTPLTFLCVLLHIIGLFNVGKHLAHVPNIIVFGIWPVLSIFLLWRIIRTIGQRVALAQFMKSAISRTKSLDFVWTSRHVEDDAWIVNELLPITTSGAVRIHRFITGTNGKAVFEDWMRDYAKLPLQTTYTRPEWDKVFNTVIEKSKSESVIGVFFCGNQGMARAVQTAAMKATEKSIKNALLRGYDGKDGRRKLGIGKSRSPGASGATRHDTDAQDSNRTLPGHEEPPGPAAYGCNVRISVRIENFS